MNRRTIVVIVGVAAIGLLVGARDLNTVKGRRALLLRAESKRASILRQAELVSEGERLKAECELLKVKPGFRELVPEEFIRKSETKLAEIEGYKRTFTESINEYNSLVESYNRSSRPFMFDRSLPTLLEPINQEELQRKDKNPPNKAL